MPLQHRPLPQVLGDGFTAAEARRAAVSTRRLHHRDVARIARGLYVRELPESHDLSGTSEAVAPSDADEHPAERWRQTHLRYALALASKLGPKQFYSGLTAALLWDLPVPVSAPEPGPRLEVACFYPHRASRKQGFTTRQVKPWLAQVVEHRGARITDPSSTWAMLAPRLELQDGVALGDSVIREQRIPGSPTLKQAPLARIEDLAAAATHRRPGVTQLRKLLPLLSPRSASAPESHLRLFIHETGLPAPALDFDVYNSSGRLLGCSEFAYPEYRLALEYEGQHHRVQTKQWNRDIEKYHDYTRAGWEVLRITAEQLYVRKDHLRSLLTDALRRRGWPSAG